MDGNFVSLDEAIQFFSIRGYDTIHHLGGGRVLMNPATYSFIHIAPKGYLGFAAYEITADQLQDMLEQMDYAERDRYGWDYMDEMAGRAA